MEKLLNELQWLIDKVKTECNVEDQDAINLIVQSLQENKKPLADIYTDVKYVYENL